jgi:hypothetical protein
MKNAVFLRAERQADGTRTFKLKVGKPLQTSYGEDLYRQIFGDAGATRPDSGTRMETAPMAIKGAAE